MRGTMIILKPCDRSDVPEPELREFDRPPKLEELQAVVGGYLELVPRFKTFAYSSVVMDCVALCNEDGKRKQLPVNRAATLAWASALHRDGFELIDDKTHIPKEWLVGNVIVIFGDREFMSEL